MTAPHFHTTQEARAAISRIEHNVDKRPPSGINGGSSGNTTTTTPNVEPKSKDADTVGEGRSD